MKDLPTSAVCCSSLLDFSRSSSRGLRKKNLSLGSPDYQESSQDEFLARVCQHAFGMELHSLDRELLMPQSHDGSSTIFFSRPCTHLQF